METKVSRVAALIAGLVLALALAACGGGGGGSDPAPAVTPTPAVDTTPPVLTLVTTSPASTTTTIVVTSDDQLSALVALTVRNGNAVLAGSTAPNTDAHSFTWTSQSGTLPCNATLSFTAQATNVVGLTTTKAFTLSTVACPTAAWWPPAITAEEQVVSGMNVLPSSGSQGSFQVADAAWQTAVSNGTVKIFDSGTVMTNWDTHPIAWAVYQYGVLYCTLPVHKDDGGAVKNLSNPGSVCTTNSFDKEWGTALGIARHFPDIGKCYERRWNPTTLAIDDIETACK